MVKVKAPRKIFLKCADKTVTADLIQQSISNSPLQNEEKNLIFCYNGNEGKLSEISERCPHIRWFVIKMTDTELYINKGKDNIFYYAGNTEESQEGLPVLSVDEESFTEVFTRLID